MTAVSHDLRVVSIRLIAVLLLAGCTVLRPTMDTEKNAAEPERTAVKAVPQEKPEITKRVIEFEQLTGLGESEVEDLLGRPNAISERPPATLWYYMNGPCALRLSFYFDLDSQRRQVLAYATDALKPSSDGEQSDVCATTIAAQNDDATR